MATDSPPASVPVQMEAFAAEETNLEYVAIQEEVGSNEVTSENVCSVNVGDGKSMLEGDQQVPEHVEEEENEQEQQVRQQAAKISGYLEKKGKLRMVSSWKKYWFVLEGRLLLYYRSRAEYDTLSPCKGSITLGSPCNIKPGPASHCVFQIETRNNTIVLRAENRAEQDKWMLAILGALNQTASATNQTKLSHFRYSADDLAARTPTDKPPKPTLLRQNTLPERIKEIPKEPQMMKEKDHAKKKEKSPKNAKTIVERLQGIGAQSYVTNSALENVKLSKASPKLPKNENLKKLLDKLPSESADTSTIKDDWIKEEDVEAYGEIKENDLYDVTDPPVVPENNPTNGDNIMVENLVYVTVDEGVPTKESSEPEKHIYQEIPSIDNKDIVIENTEYAQVPVDHNKNKVDYCEPLYGSNKNVYATIQDEPALPPRPGQTREEKSEKKNKDGDKATRLKKLAKMVKEERKDGCKRQSFVTRMFKKIKKHDNNKEEAKREAEKEKVKDLTHHNTNDNNGLVEDKESILNDHEDGPELNPKLVDELKDVLLGKSAILHEEQQKEPETEDYVKEETTPIPLETACSQMKSQTNLVGDYWIQEDMSLVNESVVMENKEQETGSSALPKEEEPSQHAGIPGVKRFVKFLRRSSLKSQVFS